MSVSSSLISRQPPLQPDGSNWVVWKVGAKAVLMREGTWEEVGGLEGKEKGEGEGDAAAPAPKLSPKDILAKAVAASASYSALLLMAGESYYEELDALTEKTGAAAWAHLCGIHEKGSRTNRIEFKRAFYTLKHNKQEPISVYTTAATSLFARLKSIKVELKDQDLADLLIGNLHSSYGSVATALALRTEENTSTQVISALKEEEQRRVASGEIDGFQDEERAMKVANVRRRSGASSFSVGPSSSSPCRRCGARDHWIRDCKAEKKENKQDVSLGVFSKEAWGL